MNNGYSVYLEVRAPGGVGVVDDADDELVAAAGGNANAIAEDAIAAADGE
jgi:hypothetical protein